MADIAPASFLNLNAPAQTAAETGLINQNAGLVNQQTQQAAMNTDVQRASMPLIMQALTEASADRSDSNPGNPDAGIGGTGSLMSPAARAARADRSGVEAPLYEQQSLEDTMRDKNFVQPYTPQELQMLKVGTALSMNPNNPGAGKALIDRMMAQRQARIDNTTATNQLNMGNVYDKAAAVSAVDTSSSPGARLAALDAIDKPDADAIRKKATGPDGKLDPVLADDLAKQYTDHLAAVSHLYSGRPTKVENGQLIDEKTAQAVVGQKQTYTGSTAEQLGADRKWAQEQVDVPLTSGGSVKMPRWKAPAQYSGMIGPDGNAIGDGNLTPDQYALQQDQMRRKLPPEQRTDSGGPSVPGAQVRANANASGTYPAGTKPAVGATAPATRATTVANPPIPKNPGPPPPSGTPAYTQRMNVALSDPAYKAQYGPQATQTKTGLPVAGQPEGIKTYQEQQKALREYATEMAQSSDQSLQNFNAAKALLATDQPLPVTGPVGAIMQHLSAMGIDTSTAAARQEAAKYLVQGAVAGLKQTYGSRPGVFDVKINVEKAFPNLESMGINEVRNLIDSQITQAQYLKDTANRATVYAQRGLEPGNFSEWNAHYFSRANLVTPKNTTPIEISKQSNPQKAYDDLPDGAPYIHDGRTLYKGGKAKQ